MYHPFTIADTLRKAWDLIKKNYIILIVFTMITFFCNLGIKVISDNITTENTYASIGIRLLIMLLEAYVTLAFYKLLLTLLDREYYEFSFKDIIPTFKMALSAVAVGVIVIVTLGTTLFINNYLPFSDEVVDWIFKLEMIAIIYLAIRLIFCLCFIVDDDSGPVESLGQSLKITRHNFFRLLALVLMIIFFVALILIIINLLVTLFIEDDDSLSYLIEIAAICWFAIAFPSVQVMIIATYRKLVYSTQDLDDDIAETN